ncbi:DUF2523 family protein [Candidatus Thioglobus sp.]|uniref:DUF2523 family protein n=1 Tax=Candidatus Thioglobus sp. TaxID=2026721 RepID=UPI003D0A3601
MLRWIYVIAAFGLLLGLGINDYLITSNIFSALPSSVLFFIDFFEIPQGLNIVISAYILRFLIRRLHFVS